MLSHTNVHVGRRYGVSLALAGLAIAVPACFLPVPPVDVDPSSESSSAAGTSTGEQPTTGGESTSSDEPGSTSTGSTSGASTTEAEGSDGTTEFSLPTCPYDPPRSNVTLETSEDGDLALQACGTTRIFDQLLLGGLGGAPLEFSVCSDAACGNCVADEKVLLNVSIPDPFEGYGGGVVEGGCYEVEVKWERPSMDEPGLCSASTVRIQRLVEGEPSIVPSMLYRLSGMLDVVDEIGDEFSLAAASAGEGTIKCPCDGDCCRDAPGTRDVQFTVTIGGTEFTGEPLMAEQSQAVKLGEDKGENSAGISLVRSHFPSECAAPGVFEWVFRHPSAF
jgi:hypothetical protein